jgi:catechol 2,3-dioxygenase-like lactoylglutathione lyase family enzyme
MKVFLALSLALAAMPVAYSQGTIVNNFMMITMAVSNMDKSKEFYTMLGLKATRDYSQGGQRWVALALPGGGASLNLSSTTDGSSKPALNVPGTVVLYFMASDVAAAQKELRAKNIKVSEVNDDLYGPGSGVKWLGLADPDGIPVIIAESKFPGQ